MASGIPETMRALVLTAPNEFEVRQVPVPKPVGDEVLCRVHACAICGTDPKIVKGAYPNNWPPSYPFIIGHEWSGEIVALGPDVAASPQLAAQYAVGTRVEGDAHKGCGQCQNCLTGHYTICSNYGDLAAGHRHYGFRAQGAYAEYTVASLKAVHKLPDALTYEEGAMLDTAGVALQGIKRGEVKIGDTVVVMGPGPIGIFSAHFAKAQGAKEVIVVGRGDRLAIAKEFGYTVVDREAVDPVKKVRELTGGIGAEVVIEAAGTRQSCQQSIGMVRKGGKLVMSGMPTEPVEIPWTQILLDEIDMVGVRANPNTSEPALAIIGTGAVTAKGLITHTFPLEKFGDALDTFVNRKGGAMKVVIKP